MVNSINSSGISSRSRYSKRNFWISDDNISNFKQRNGRYHEINQISRRLWFIQISENETKFLNMWLSILGASLLGNVSTGKEQEE